MRVDNPICKFLSGLILIHFLNVSYARENQNPHCKPSTCGDIATISYPFRLKSDPQNCGDHNYELECENNTTLLYLDSHKYYVKAINYQNYTIHLTDASIKQDDHCSFPNHSLYFGYDSPYRTQSYSNSHLIEPDMVTPITFISCPNPLNGSQFVHTDYCVNRSYDLNSSTFPTKKLLYIKIGYLETSDLKQMCTTDLVTMTSMRFRNPNRASIAEIHASLLYGFELSWFSVRCPKCRGQASCWFDGNTCGVIACDENSVVNCVGFIDYPPPFINEIVAVLLGYLLFIIGYGIVVRVLCGCPFILGFIIYKCRRRHLSTFNEVEGFLQHYTSGMPIRYSYSDIKKMTRGFREKLGQGGYGCVYKGKLRSGHEVAIKLLSNLKANGQDFINEVGTIGRIHHVNVVKLVGYCRENSSFALVYDFMPNGSLDQYILSQERSSSSKSLSWEKKHAIALGVARGIHYLHQGCSDVQILHFDIKPHNILLDHDFNPKISDFGLAKLYSNENSIVSLTNARGTIGYVAPELINKSIGGVSHKADVYSFGMLLIEIAGAMIRNNDSNESSQYFPYCIYDWLEKGKEIEADEDICEDDDDERVRRMKWNMVVVGLWCVRMSPNDRPSMSKVVEMLEEDDGGFLDMPPKPSTSPPRHANAWVGDGSSTSCSRELLYDFPSSYM